MTPSTPQPGAITLVDPLDPALKLGAVKVNGSRWRCGRRRRRSATSCSLRRRRAHRHRRARRQARSPRRSRRGRGHDAAVGRRRSAERRHARPTPTGATQTASQPLTVLERVGDRRIDHRDRRQARRRRRTTSCRSRAGRRAARPADAVRGRSLTLDAVARPARRRRRASPPPTAASRRQAGRSRRLAARPRRRRSRPAPPSASACARALNGRAVVGGRETMRADAHPGRGDAGRRPAPPCASKPTPSSTSAPSSARSIRDDNGNGARDRGEPGIGGALVVMDDGLQAVTDAAGRYHLAAIAPGDRAIKVAELHAAARLDAHHRRHPHRAGDRRARSSRSTSACSVPAPEPPLARPQVATVAARAAPDRRRRPRLPPRRHRRRRRPRHRRRPRRARRQDRRLGVDVDLRRAAEPLRACDRAGPTAASSSRRATSSGSSAPRAARSIVPRDEEPRMTLRFPAGALAEPTFLLEGAVHRRRCARSPSPASALVPDKTGNVALKLRVPESGAGIAVDAALRRRPQARFDHTLQAVGRLRAAGRPRRGQGRLRAEVGRRRQLARASTPQGRVKLYAKGRIQGRWLLEGGIDIDTSQLDSWRDLFRGDPQAHLPQPRSRPLLHRLRRRLADDAGGAVERAALRAHRSIDRSELLFGNLQTGLTGVEMGRYSRAVTGGRLELRARRRRSQRASRRRRSSSSAPGCRRARAHDELRGSGGSLYYLSHRNVVEGSEQVRIEIRDQISNRPVGNTAQHATVDYEVDYLAGRIIMRDPVSSVAPSPTLVRSSQRRRRPGLRHRRLRVHRRRRQRRRHARRARHAEARPGAPRRHRRQRVPRRRQLHAARRRRADRSQEVGRHHRRVRAQLRRAHARSPSSDDGGLTYTDALGTSQAPATTRQGNAYKAEADLHLGPVSLHPYFRGIDQGYTDTAHAAGRRLHAVGRRSLGALRRRRPARALRRAPLPAGARLRRRRHCR